MTTAEEIVRALEAEREFIQENFTSKDYKDGQIDGFNHAIAIVRLNSRQWPEPNEGTVTSWGTMIGPDFPSTEPRPEPRWDKDSLDALIDKRYPVTDMGRGSWLSGARALRDAILAAQPTETEPYGEPGAGVWPCYSCGTSNDRCDVLANNESGPCCDLCHHVPLGTILGQSTNESRECPNGKNHKVNRHATASRRPPAELVG